MRDVLPESAPAFLRHKTGEVCGTCLLGVEADAQVGLVDCCTHVFHFECVQRWSETENTCPQCKLRFFWLAAYTPEGRRTSLARVERRDQEGEEDDDYEDIQLCEKCNQVGDEAALLLCDGMHGTCNAAYHYTCVGLNAIPRGSWFCPDCVERGFDTDARGRRKKQQTTLDSEENVGSVVLAPSSQAELELLHGVLSQAAATSRAETVSSSSIVAPSPNGSGGKSGRSNASLPPQLRLSALACVTAPVQVPTFHPDGGSTSSRDVDGSTSTAGRSQPTGIFASFVQRRRAQQGKATSSGDGATGFIKLNPQYEEDFMGGKVNK